MMLEEDMILVLAETDGRLKVKSAKQMKRLFRLTRKKVLLSFTSE